MGDADVFCFVSTFATNTAYHHTSRPSSIYSPTIMSFHQSKRSDWETQAFWEKICPSLTIGSKDPIPNPVNFHADRSGDTLRPENTRERLRKRGYALVDQQVFPKEKLEMVRKGIEVLHESGFPASFILLFDVTWDLAAVSRQLFKTTCLETNEFQFDILAWHISGKGFSPHRDRQPEDAAKTFVGEDAKFVTHWIALTPATPQNSCLYMIPKEHDPGYLSGDTDEEDPLHRALCDKTKFQRIVALPRNPGQSLLFTHRIIHWGSARDPGASDSLGPRMAISFVCSDPSFEKPFLANPHFSTEERPSFRIRLLLVCSQLLIYHERFDLPKEILKLCYEICKEMEAELEVSYRHKVYLEFVRAMKEMKGDGEGNHTASDDEEAVLDAMLEAEEGGYGDNLVDDYDADDGEVDDDEEEQESCLTSQPESKRLKTGMS